VARRPPAKIRDDMRDTKDRILDTALDLFIKQGYDKTSLREIAEQVGVTKAALYYHFASKEEIFRTLVQPVVELQAQAMSLLQERPTVEAWGTSLARLVDWILPHRRLFQLFETNQGTVRALAEQMITEGEYAEVHDAMHVIVDTTFSDASLPLADRVRMAGAIGLVMGVIGFAAGRAFTQVPTDELRPVLIEAIDDVLRIGEKHPPRGGRTV